MSIVVVGSLNIDRFSRVARLPRAGETMLAQTSFTRLGGKGANQAVAAARLGARVTMVGALGGDEAGRAYRRHLEGEGIDTAMIVDKGSEVATGVATIAVDAGGENFIIVDPGANGRLTAGDVRAARAAIASARVLLLQLEVPLDAALEALRLARACGVAVVFNPSPWMDAFPWREVALHTVIVNEGEARAWLGSPRFPGDVLLERMILTQGAQPTLAWTADNRISVAPPEIRPVDTVGAGDAFAGAYAVAVMEDRPLRDALRFANAAGALATLRSGAQEALPDRCAVEASLARGW